MARNFLKAQLAEMRTVVSTSYERFDLPQERRELMSEVTYYVALPFVAPAEVRISLHDLLKKHFGDAAQEFHKT